MTHSTQLAPPDFLRRLAIAGWGVGCGVLFATTFTATLIAVRCDTENRRHAALLSSQYLKEIDVVHWQERYEHSWYALVCAGGALCGWAALRFARVSPWPAMLAAIAFVPFAAWACRGVFAGSLAIERLLACTAILAVPLLWRTRSIHNSALPETTPAAIASGHPKAMWLTAALLCLPLSALLYGLLGPHDVPSVASECNSEMHVGSYLLGPALYYRAPEVVPALDFESHYGIGHAYTFSLVMGGRGLQSTLERYILFVLVMTILYFLSAHLVLTDWLRKPWAALAITLALVGVNCEGLAYNYPSGWPIRHPFLFAFLFAAVRGVGDRWWLVVAGGVAGLSLWWQTDIGLYTLAAGFALYLAIALFLGGSVWRPVAFVVVAIGSFFALCTVLFGPRVLSVAFAERLLEPLLLYAAGFGNELMNWRPGWSYWYNLLGPGLAIASVAVFIGQRKGEVVPARPVVYGAAASLLALAMLFKWVNRSFDVLWGMNGGLVIAVAGWWVCVAWQAFSERLADGCRPRVASLRRAAAAVALLALLVQLVRIDARSATSKYRGRSSSPLVRIAIWLGEFRNPINAARKGIKPYVYASPIDSASAQYLRDHTRKTERVALISGFDWNYLVDAGRAPRLYWLQLTLVHSPTLLGRCAEDLRNSERVFVERDALTALKRINSAAHDAVVPILAERFELADQSSPRWHVYRRKPGPTAGQ